MTALQKCGENGYNNMNKEKAIELAFQLKKESELRKAREERERIAQVESANHESYETDFARCLELMKTSRVSKMSHIPYVG